MTRRKIGIGFGSLDPRFKARVEPGFVLGAGEIFSPGIGSGLTPSSIQDSSSLFVPTFEAGGEEPSDPTYPNKPTGLTTILDYDGSFKEGGTGGTHAFGHDSFGSWSSPSPDTIQVVADPSNPRGSGFALQFTYPAGSDAGQATAGTFPGGPFRRLYYSFWINYVESGWDTFGRKIFYTGTALGSRHLGAGYGSPTQIYNDFPGPGALNYRLLNQNNGSVVINRIDEPPPIGGNILWPGYSQWVQVEHLLVAQSAPGVSDGHGGTWINGQPAGYVTNVAWIPAGRADPNAIGFDGMQWYAVANDVPETGIYLLGGLLIAGESY